MPRPILIQSIAVSAAWQPLAASRTVMTASITTSPANTQPVQFRVDGGATVPWPAGVSNTLVSVDLSRIEVSGTSGDTVLVVGGMGKRPRVMSMTGGGGGSGSTGIGSGDTK